MKVLQPPELETKKREEEAQKVQKAVKIHELVREEETALNLARENHRKNIEQLATNFLAFSKEIDQRKSLLQMEVDDLEARKLKALEPLDASFKEAKQKMDEVALLEKTLQSRKAELDSVEISQKELREKFEERKKELEQWEREIAEEQKATAIIKERTSQAALKLDRDKRFFDVWKDKLVQNMGDSDALIQKERAEIEAQRKLNEQQRVENQNELRRIQDQRATLQTAFEELREQQQKQNG